MNELAKFLLLSNDDLETAQLLCDSGRYRSEVKMLLAIAYSPHQTAIAPHHHQNPIAFSPNSNSDCPLSPQTRSPISQHQSAIAPPHS